MYILFIAITIFVSLLFILIYLLFFEKKVKIRNRLETYTSNIVKSEYKEVDVKIGSKKEKFTILGLIGKILPLENYFQKKKVLLTQARLLIKPEEFFGICLIVGFIFTLIFFLLFDHFIFAIIGFVIGFKIPGIYVKSIKKSRAKKLNNQLPEALSIIANGLRAGLSFNQALMIAGKEMDAPIAEDFNRIVHENVLGKEMEEALKDFAERTADDDVEILVTAVLIQRQVGGNLSEILDTISNTIRERVKLKGDISTMTAQAKLSAVIIGLIPPIIFAILYALNKEFMLPLFTTLLGNIMIIAAVTMQAIGVFILVKMLDLKV
ncbi:MAG: tight adherence protein B [Fusobacteria bacterium]|nr:MAG: tight adherence protein B [Fusobacteriota bacterium]KAF0229765.1 MAG: tight adherence protein [Fusobacteriota bacterium]